MIDITLRKFAKFSNKLKTTVYKLLTATFTFLSFLTLHTATFGQQDSTLFKTVKQDTATSNSSIVLIEEKSDSTASPKSSIDNIINYNATDSMWFDVKTQTVILYGDAHADYGSISVEAEHIKIDWAKQLITATYMTDSTGKKIGIPVFKDKDDRYVADTIAYNVETKKGYISQIYTQQNGDHLRAQKVYKDQNDNLYMADATYCPCEDSNSTTYFKTKKLKVVPEKKVFAGPALLYIGNVPTPIGLPFGIFPVTNKKASGIILPDFNYSELRGYFLTDGGFYWGVNEYVGMRFLGSVYSNGGGAFGIDTDYKRRYRYQGSMIFDYTKEVQNGDEFNRTDIRNYQFKWRHTPQSRGGRQLSANVDLASKEYNYRNEINAQDGLKNTMNSSIQYSLPFNGTPFRSSISLRHSQNNETGFFDFTLPTLNLNMNRVYPLRFNKKTKDYDFEPLNVTRDFYQSLSFTVNSTYKKSFSNRPITEPKLPFDLANFDESNQDTLDLTFSNFDRLNERSKTNITYKIPVQATLKLARGKIALTPSFNYTGHIYPESYDYRMSEVYDEETDTYKEAFIMDTVSSFGHAYSYNTAVSTQTNIYGIYKFKKPGLPKFMHRMTPSVGMRFSPEFSDIEKYSQYYSKVYSASQDTTYYIAKYLGSSFPTGSKQSSLTFSLNNTLQMKKTKLKEGEKAPEAKTILNTFRIGSAYNFAAEEFNLANFSISGRAKVLKDLIDINYSSTIDPYYREFDSTQLNFEERNNVYAWKNNQGIGNLTYQSIIIGMSSFNASSLKKLFTSDNKETDLKADSTDQKEDKLPNGYEPIKMPWSFGITYSFVKTRLGYDEEGNVEFSPRKTINFNSTVDLTDKMKVSFNTSYDLVTKNMAGSNVSIYRDLGCWEARLTWIPFGSRSRHFNFSINIKTPTLRNDLQYQKQRRWIDN